MMWIILFRNVILQTKTIILLSTKIISLAKIIQNEITVKSTLHFITFYFAPVLFTNRKSDFLQCMQIQKSNQYQIIKRGKNKKLNPYLGPWGWWDSILVGGWIQHRLGTTRRQSWTKHFSPECRISWRNRGKLQG